MVWHYCCTYVLRWSIVQYMQLEPYFLGVTVEYVFCHSFLCYFFIPNFLPESLPFSGTWPRWVRAHPRHSGGHSWVGHHQAFACRPGRWRCRTASDWNQVTDIWWLIFGGWYYMCDWYYVTDITYVCDWYYVTDIMWLTLHIHMTDITYVTDIMWLTLGDWNQVTDNHCVIWWLKNYTNDTLIEIQLFGETQSVQYEC